MTKEEIHHVFSDLKEKDFVRFEFRNQYFSISSRGQINQLDKTPGKESLTIWCFNGYALEVLPLKHFTLLKKQAIFLEDA